MNTKTSPHVRDTRVYRSYDIGSDHYLLMSTITIPHKWQWKNKEPSKSIPEKTFKVNLLDDKSIRDLYQSRVDQKTYFMPVSNNINTEWEELKTILKEAASEALGKRNKRRNKRCLHFWNEDIKSLVQNKKQLYLNYLNTRSDTDYINYKKQCAIVKKEIRKLKRESWEKFIADIEYDVQGRQTNAYKVLKKLNRDEKDDIQINPITGKVWLDYYTKLWTEEENNISPMITINIDNNVDPITIDELKSALKTCRNRKAPGSDEINMELIKYAPERFLHRFLNFLNICWKCGHIPEEWQTAIVVPIFKKGDRKDCSNYRGISLLNTGYKVYSKIITKRLNVIADTMLMEEQNGFRSNRSCIDSVFSLSQIIEKHREYNIPTCIAFIDYEKAFDTVKRDKLWEILIERGIPKHLITTIQCLYKNTTIKIKLNKGITNEIREITRGVRQGCPLSPTLFNFYIDEVTRQWQINLKSNFNINKDYLNTLLFADDQVIFSNSEDNLQRALYNLNIIAKEFNLNISLKKTKVMGFKGKTPIRLKIILNDEPVEQVNHFEYLGCTLSYDNINDFDKKILKFQKLVGTVKRTFVKKVRANTVLKFYKTMVIPTLVYGSEIWSLTKQQERRMEAAEMKLLRPLAGYTLLDHKPNKYIRQELGISNIIDVTHTYINRWHEHVERMSSDRVPRKLHNYRPVGRRDVGRPRRRWRDQF